MLHFIKLKEKGDENEMKKWTARILAMLMILALVGCGGDSGAATLGRVLFLSFILHFLRLLFDPFPQPFYADQRTGAQLKRRGF